MWPAIKRIEGLKYFDVRAEKNMFSAFYGLTELEELDVSEFDTSGVESMAHMFSYCSKLKSDVLNQIDTSSAINMTYMFRYCSAFEKVDLSNIDTSNVKTMQGMFHSCIHIKTADLSSVDTGNVEIMSSMFDACSQLTSVDLTGVDTSKLTNIGSMFFNCQQLTSVNFGTAFEENIITNISYLFYFCRSLTKVDVSKFNTSNVTNMKFMFSRCSSLENLDITNFDTGNVTYMQSLFSECKKLSSISIDSTKFVTSKVTDMNSMFKDCEKLSSLDISSFSTSNVTDMNNMFYNCELLQKLDLNSFNTSKVTNMSSMFYNCNGLFELDLSNFNTSQVTNMSAMFYNCKSFTELDLSNFNTSQVTDMSNMFGMNDENNKLSKLVLSSFITSQVTDMSNMFENGKNLTELDLSNFDTSEVTKMSYMFRGCGFENIGDTGLIINKFNTSKVTDMNNMFWFCDKAVTIDLTTTENVDGTYCWDTSNVTNMNQMFSHCYMATSIVIDHWSSESILNFDNVFSNCTSIENLDISSMQFPQIYLEAVSTMNIITGCKSLDEMIVFSQHIEDKIDTTGLSVKIVVADSVANSFPLGDANYAPSIADNSINNSIEDTIQENFFDEPIDTYTVVTAPESESSDYKNITSSDTINYGLVLTGTVINYKVVIRPVVEESTNNTRSGVITVTNTLPKEVEFNKKTDNGENFVFRYNIYKRGTFNDVEPVIPTNSSAVVVGGPAGIVYDDATRTITAKVSGLAADEELVFYYSTTVTANPQGECYYVPIQNQYTMEENGIKVFSNSTLHYLKKAVDAVSTYEASYSYDNTCTEIAPHTEIHKSSEQFTLPTPVTVAGYTFNGWLCDYNSLTYSQDTTFTMPAENVHFTGSYTKNTVTQTFTLSYKYILEGNKVEVETYNYPVGVYKLITDEVIGEKNYYDYNDSYVYNDNIGAVTIEIDTVYFDKDVTVTRNFTRKPYTITWLDFDGNTSQTESYKWGDKTIAVAEPSKENYIFQNWIDTETGETAVSLDQDGTFIVPQRDVILKPIYIENPTYILTYQVREEGEGIWFSTIEYNEGEVVTLSDLPSLGFRIGEEWILDDTLLENGETVQITMVDGKQTLTMPKSNVTVYVDKINLIVPNTGISVDYSQWIGITGISLALLIIKNRFRKRGGAYGRK